MVFKKKKHSHFYNRTAVPDPKATTLHGGGKYCFPGGEQTEAIAIDGARREFHEEMGIPIPVAVIQTRSFVAGTGTGCCFQLSPADLIALKDDVTAQLDLANSDDWSKAECTVQDNELKNPALVVLADLPGTYFSATDADTDWFHSFVTQLKA